MKTWAERLISRENIQPRFPSGRNQSAGDAWDGYRLRNNHGAEADKPRG